MLDRQDTVDFYLDRLGSVGGSTVGDAIAVRKRGEGRLKASLDLMYELAAERVTGCPAKRVNALQWGVDHEDEARTAYEFVTNAEITRPGVIRHPRIAGAHASPDAFVGDDGGLELKCPTSSTHLQTLLADAIPADHMPQIVWNLACSGRAWWDFCSFDPRFPEGLQLFVKRLERDEAAIATMEAEVEAFLAELDGKLEALAERYGAWERP
jgi:YqaJ-like recombinase protein